MSSDDNAGHQPYERPAGYARPSDELIERLVDERTAHEEMVAGRPDSADRFTHQTTAREAAAALDGMPTDNRSGKPFIEPKRRGWFGRLLSPRED